MKYRLVETKEIIDRVLKFSESHANSKHNGNIVDIIEMYQERPELFRWLHIYEAVSEVTECHTCVYKDTSPTDEPCNECLSDIITRKDEEIRTLTFYKPKKDAKSFKTNYIFIKVPYEDNSRDIPDTLNFSQNDLKCMQRVAMANPNLLRLQTLYSKWDLEWSWSQSSFFSIFIQMLWSIKGDLMKGGVK